MFVPVFLVLPVLMVEAPVEKLLVAVKAAVPVHGALLETMAAPVSFLNQALPRMTAGILLAVLFFALIRFVLAAASYQVLP